MLRKIIKTRLMFTKCTFPQFSTNAVDKIVDSWGIDKDISLETMDYDQIVRFLTTQYLT